MSDSLKHTFGVLCAGALAFGAVLSAVALSPGPSAQPHAEHEDHPSAQGDSGLARDLLGRWQAPRPANPNAYVEFTKYGLWFSSDGCNRLDGNWSADSSGALQIESSQVMTRIGCDNVAIPTAVVSAASAEVQGDELILTSADGEETRLERHRGDSVSLIGAWVPENAVDGPEIDFTSEESITATDGCNSASGTWALNAAHGYGFGAANTEPAPLPGALSISLSGWTEMGCPGNAQVNYLQRFAEATHLSFIDEDHVFIMAASADGETAFENGVTLVRKTAPAGD